MESTCDSSKKSTSNSQGERRHCGWATVHSVAERNCYIETRQVERSVKVGKWGLRVVSGLVNTGLSISRLVNLLLILLISTE